jgi:hypothetical protein
MDHTSTSTEHEPRFYGLLLYHEKVQAVKALRIDRVVALALCYSAHGMSSHGHNPRLGEAGTEKSKDALPPGNGLICNEREVYYG